MQLLTARLPWQPDIHSGTLEGIKWLAVLFMTLDHVNLQLMQSAYPFMYNLGRISLPLFIFVLAYNLAQPRAIENQSARRVLERLLPVALIASLPYLHMNLQPIGFFPLNILFTLAGGVAMVVLLEQPGRWRLVAAVVLLLAVGGYVEYGWVGIALFATAWQLFRTGSIAALLATLVLVVMLGTTYNGNQWALLAVAIFAAASFIRLPIPRIRSALYAYYPGHLLIIAILQIILVAR